jgi:hypothetical protein
VLKVFYVALGIISALAGLMSLPYLFMATHNLFGALRGQQLPPITSKWDPYAEVGLMGSLSFGAIFMAFRLLRYAFTAKTTD